MDIPLVVSYFKDAYQSRSGIPHTPIPQQQIDRFETIIDEYYLSEEDVLNMIDAYFDVRFRERTDYRFGHFASDMVIEILYFQNVQ